MGAKNNKRRACFVAIALLLSTAATPTFADTIYQSATYTGNDTGEYILTDYDLIGGAFTVTGKTSITAIGAQFGGYPSGSIFGAIIAVDPTTGIPLYSKSQLETNNFGHVVFSVPQVTATDLAIPLSLTLDTGTYGVVFGSGLFGTTGNAGLGYLNDTISPDGVFRSFFSDGYQTFADSGVRVFVEGEAVAAVPEASTWAMMLVGFVGIGFMTYREKRRRVTLSFA